MRRTLMRATAAAAGILLLAASPAPAALASPSSPTRPDGSAGCTATAPHLPGSTQKYAIDSGGREREYLLRLPAGYTTDRPWPLVLAFHGRGSDGAATEGFSKLSELPAIVVYPYGEFGTGDGHRRAWQGAPYEPPGVDDVAFTDDLLDELEATTCVDDRRVYATGKSNGAAFAGILACRRADRFAAIAPVAGAFYPTGETCEPSRPVSVLEIHGTGDATIPYAGDEDRGLPAIRSWVADWARRDGCAAGPSERPIRRDVVAYRYADCDPGTSVEHVAVTGGGHTWPGADSYSGGGYTTQSIEAHEVIWRFFRDHRLPEEAS